MPFTARYLVRYTPGLQFYRQLPARENFKLILVSSSDCDDRTLVGVNANDVEGLVRYWADSGLDAIGNAAP